MSSGCQDDRLLQGTAYAVVDVYEYQHAKMYMELFCQGESGSLYRIIGLYRDGSPKVIENPVWEATQIRTSDYDAPAQRTALAAVVHYDGPGVPTVHLFYLDKSFDIREVVWVNGEEVSRNSLNIKAAPNGSLAATYWREGQSTTHLRLYYQSDTRSGVIKEHCKTGNGYWEAGSSLDFTTSDSDGIPLSGTSLAFINSSLSTPSIYGYWQSSKGNLREVRSNNGRTYTIHWSHDLKSPRTELAAVKIRDRSDVDIYYVKGDDTIRNCTAEGNTDLTIDTVKLEENSRIAAVPTDAGFHLFSSGGNNGIVHRMHPKGSSDWKSPSLIRLASTSPLKFGKA
ncbi:hypothetical protein ABW19_dt0200958 [Dactylella cylindrospora]|nr:hypothetical protein ABW19_dt0200958 [Dactylella cylindrospora]